MLRSLWSDGHFFTRNISTPERDPGPLLFFAAFALIAVAKETLAPAMGGFMGALPSPAKTHSEALGELLTRPKRRADTCPKDRL